jgi:hypothetical protein
LSYAKFYPFLGMVDYEFFTLVCPFLLAIVAIGYFAVFRKNYLLSIGIFAGFVLGVAVLGMLAWGA